MPRRISDRDGCTVGDSQKIAALQSRRVDDRLQIADEMLEVEMRRLPLRPAEPAHVGSHQPAGADALTIPVAVDGARPVMAEVRHPVLRLDDREPFTRDGIGNPRSISPGAIAADLDRLRLRLLHGNGWKLV